MNLTVGSVWRVDHDAGVGGTAANNASFRGIQFLPGGATAAYDFGTRTTSTNAADRRRWHSDRG